MATATGTTTSSTATRITGHCWERLPRRGGWRLVITADDGSAGTLRIRFIGNTHTAEILTDDGARRLLHLVDQDQLLARLHRSAA